MVLGTWSQKFRGVGLSPHTDWPFAQYPDISASQKIATLIENPRLKNLDFETQNIKA